MPSRPIVEIIAEGNLLESLEALRDQLAAELDDLKWAKHKRECQCHCGMTDLRARVAVTKELREVLAKIDAIPKIAKEASAVDSVIAAAAKRRDELAARRANRESGSSAS